MQSTIALILALAFSISHAVAQNQTAPFNLVISSANKTLDGTFLGACHEGAAYEGLCPGPANATAEYNQYALNFTASDTPDPVLGITGQLTWVLQGGNFNLSSPLSIVADLISNVAIPIFVPGYGPGAPTTTIGFDKDNKLFVPQSYDDTVVPRKLDPKPIQRWYVCTTQYGYLYTTLAWVVGPHDPENPSCQKVDVKRVFV
ncbi:hypothetical protein N431DRAFT_548528 [Stipitochalara longipes BDJ]|nr:hypothetical protein N431DRAFT_548528 [Stipitochalara longipes BDJ]